MLEEEDKHKYEMILEVRKDVNRYFYYKNSTDLGITYSYRDIPFTDLLLFGWIKGVSNG